MLTAYTFQLSYRYAELIRYRSDCNGPREILLHEQQRAPHARLANCLGERRVRLGIAAGTLAIEQQYLARLLRNCPSPVLLDQVCRKSGRASSAGAGDPRAVGKEQPIGDDRVSRKCFEEVLVVIPAHARAAAFHQARPAQYEAARANPDQRDIAGSSLAQVADGGLIYLRAGVEDSSNDDNIVEQLGLDEAARRLDEHT